MRRPFLLLPFLLPLLLTGCSSSGQPAPVDDRSGDDGLLDTAWQVVGVSGVTSPEPDLPHDANLTFGSDGRLSGNAGCNSFFGEHSSRTSRNTHVRVSDIGITQMACPDRADWMGLFEALAGKLAITVDGASATLTSETGAVVELEFLGPNPPRQPLDDPDQPVSTVNEG